MKLFVDDIRNAPDESWTVARTVASAIRALAMFEFEAVSLDHDISHQVSIGTELERPFPCTETFQPVAHYLALQYRDKVGYPTITIHTANPVGAEEMKRIFTEARILCEVKRMGAANRLETEV